MLWNVEGTCLPLESCMKRLLQEIFFSNLLHGKDQECSSLQI